jgi:hypothetical protein
MFVLWICKQSKNEVGAKCAAAGWHQNVEEQEIDYAEKQQNMALNHIT